MFHWIVDAIIPSMSYIALLWFEVLALHHKRIFFLLRVLSMCRLVVVVYFESRHMCFVIFHHNDKSAHTVLTFTVFLSSFSVSVWSIYICLMYLYLSDLSVISCLVYPSLSGPSIWLPYVSTVYVCLSGPPVFPIVCIPFISLSLPDSLTRYNDIRGIRHRRLASETRAASRQKGAWGVPWPR